MKNGAVAKYSPKTNPLKKVPGTIEIKKILLDKLLMLLLATSVYNSRGFGPETPTRGSAS